MKNGKQNTTGAYTSRSAGQGKNTSGASAKFSQGTKTGLERNPDGPAMSGGGSKAGNMNIMRKPYK
jgi:hypothetical protein